MLRLVNDVKKYRRYRQICRGFDFNSIASFSFIFIKIIIPQTSVQVLPIPGNVMVYWSLITGGFRGSFDMGA